MLYLAVSAARTDVADFLLDFRRWESATHKPEFAGEWVKLGDVCEIVNGATPRTEVPEYWGGDIKWVTPAELRNEINTVFDTAKHLTKAGFESASLRMMPAGTILLTTRAPIGKLALAGDEMCCNQGFKCLICPETVNNEWLCRLLKHRVPELQAMGTGATFKELSKRAISDYKICVPPMEAQIDIVKKLTKLDEVLANCRALLSALDDLVKSQFVEMFGDPCEPSPCSFPRVALKEVCELRTGPFGSALHKEDYVPGCHPLVNPSHVVDCQIVIDNNLTVDDDTYDSMKPYHLHIGDVVLGRRGEIGRCAVVSAEGLLCGTGCMIVRPNGNACRSDYLQRVFSFPSFASALEREAVGVTMKNLNAKIVGNAVIAMPPLALQQQFADFVARVDKLGFDVQQQIEKLETLKQSLMQEYFG